MTKQNYELLIGQKFGDREILNITTKHNGRQNVTYAVCKCKCGHVGEVSLSDLKAGKRLRCSACSEFIENKSTGMKNISYDRFNDRFAIVIERNGHKAVKYTKTLDEAISIKKKLLETFTAYGRFDIEELRKDRSRKENSVRNSRKINNSYSYVIGQKLGDWEIIHVSEPTGEKNSQTNRSVTR